MQYIYQYANNNKKEAGNVLRRQPLLVRNGWLLLDDHLFGDLAVGGIDGHGVGARSHAGGGDGHVRVAVELVEYALSHHVIDLHALDLG